MIAERSVTIGGSRIRFLEAGSGDPPFLLVHGFGWGAVRWRDAIPPLADHRRTVALDLPGFGASDAPDGPYTPAWLAGAVRAFMDESGMQRAVVVGSSLGGLVSTWLAAAWPERIEGLVLVAPSLPSDAPPRSLVEALRWVGPTVPILGPALFAREMRKPPDVVVRNSLARNCADPARVSPALVSALEEEATLRASRPDVVRAMIATNRALVWALTGRRERTWAVVRALRVPTIFLWGEADAIVPVGVGHRAVGEVPGAHLVVLDECGHNPQVERPAELAAAVMAFARALAARA